MAVAYDPKILNGYAQALYAHADRLIGTSAAYWGLIVGGVLYAVGPYTGLGAAIAGGAARWLDFLGRQAGVDLVGPGGILPLGYFLLGGVVGAIFGAFLAGPRAALLRLQAQTALCQVQIEFNTRAR